MKRIIQFLKRIAFFIFANSQASGKKVSDVADSKRQFSLKQVSEQLLKSNIKGVGFIKSRRHSEWNAYVESLEDIYLWMEKIHGISEISKCNGVGSFSFTKQITTEARLKISNHSLTNSRKIAVAMLENKKGDVILKITFYKLSKRRPYLNLSDIKDDE